MSDIVNSGIVDTKSKDDRLKSFIERIERLEEEKNNILADIKEVYSEAKSSGYEPKIMRKVLLIRKMYIDERLEQEALLDTYRNALGIWLTTLETGLLQKLETQNQSLQYILKSKIYKLLKKNNYKTNFFFKSSFKF